MPRNFVLIGMTLLLGLLSATANAEATVDSINACLDQKIELGQNPTSCIDQAHLDCLQSAAETPAVGMLCFVEARQTWTEATTIEMDRITSAASEQIAAIAAIELKYDLIASLTQCDRMEELALAASRDSANSIQIQKTRCEASAAGLAFLRLKLRAQNLE